MLKKIIKKKKLIHFLLKSPLRNTDNGIRKYTYSTILYLHDSGANLHT